MHPLEIGRFKREALFPARIEQAGKRSRQLLAFELGRVVAGEPQRGAIAEPAPGRWDRPIGQIGEVWPVEWRSELLARKRLEFRAICFNDVEDAASGARFRKRALEHVLAQRPPERDFHPVL